VQAKEPGYFAAYRSLKFTRDGQGVLIVEFHTKGGPLTFTAQDHTDFVEAFYRIAQDRENKIVILTGAGGEFIPRIDFSSFGNVADPAVWSQVHDEGAQILENLANIRVPLIAAVTRVALEISRTRPERRERLASLVAYSNRELQARCGLTSSRSHILPIIVGADGKAVALAGALQQCGFDVRAIRPPTVAEGTARLRIALSANLSESVIAELFDALAENMRRLS